MVRLGRPKKEKAPTFTNVGGNPGNASAGMSAIKPPMPPPPPEQTPGTPITEPNNAQPSTLEVWNGLSRSQQELEFITVLHLMNANLEKIVDLMEENEETEAGN